MGSFLNALKKTIFVEEENSSVEQKEEKQQNVVVVPQQSITPSPTGTDTGLELVDEKKEKIAAWMEKDSNKELFAFLGALPVSGWEDEEDEEKLNEYLSCIKIINNTNRFNMQSIIKRKKAEETTDEKPAE